MKKLILILFLALQTLLSFSNKPEIPFIGIWLNPDQTICYEIYENHQEIRCKTVWVTENANEKAKATVGNDIIIGLTLNEQQLINGKVIFNNKGIICSMKLLDSKTLEVTMKKGLFNHSVIWTKKDQT